MKTKYLNLGVALIVILAMSACKKDAADKSSNPKIQSNIKSASAKILKFGSYNEFKKELEYITSATFEEKQKWEESKDFVSFGRASDEFYLSLDPEKLNIEKLKGIVEQNPEYLILLKGEDGEYTLESAFWDNPLRRFINQDKLYQIGETIYKLFSFGTVSTNEYNIKKLKSITENNYLSFKNDADLLFINSHSSDKILKDGQYNCGKDIEDRVTNGNNRIYIHVHNWNWDFEDNNFPSEDGTMNRTRYNVRPYKKTLGIWYWCIRHISCSIRIATDRYIYENETVTTPGYYRRQNQDTPPTTYSDNVEGFWDERISYDLGSPDYSHFGGYNCWGSQPSAGPVIIQCNTSIVN